MDDVDDVDDQSDDWGDNVVGFDVGALSDAQRRRLSAELADAGILHAFVGTELKGPAAESEIIEHLIGQLIGQAQRRRSGGRRFVWGVVPPEVQGLAISARWRRFVAYLAEAMAFSVVAAVIYRYSAGGAQAFSVTVGVVSSVVLVATLGTTIGMIAMRMRVVVLANPARVAVGWRVAGLRYLVAWWPEVAMIALLPVTSPGDLGWLTAIAEIWLVVCFGPILLDPARRGLHDRMAGTVVVDVSRAARS